MKLITLTAAAALAAGTAYAGGMNPAPVEPVVQAPAPIIAPSTDWTGGYAGLSLGYGEADVGTDDYDGAIGGAFAGYQYDFGSYVLGAELDLNAANIENDSVPGTIDQVHRLKLRAGYDAGDTLVYATAGAAYAEADIGGTSFDDTGYLVGAGLDYKVAPNVTVGGEVLYHDFGDNFDGTGAAVDATTVQARVAFQF